MKSSPIQAVVCWMGAGVLWVAGQLGGWYGETSQEGSDTKPSLEVEVGRPPAPTPHGSGHHRSASSIEEAPREERVIRAKVTAYCLCKICCGKWAKLPDRVTSIGDNAKVFDGVAADPKLLPYRTRLNIPGIGIKEVDDTGGGMRQSAKRGIYHIDVRMPSHRQALQWGVHWLDIKVLEQ